jgi:hypothetical protein
MKERMNIYGIAKYCFLIKKKRNIKSNNNNKIEIEINNFEKKIHCNK